MAHSRLFRSGLRAAGVSLLALVSACGGGGDSPSPQSEIKPTVEPTSLTKSAVLPLAVDASSSSLSAVGAPAPLSVMAGLAAGWLPSGFQSASSTKGLIMPLAQAHWRNVARAAQGGLQSKATSLAKTPAMTAFLNAPLGALNREAWGQRDHLFNNTFLSDLRLAAAVSPVSAYVAAPLDFAQSRELGSAGFSASLEGTVGLDRWSRFEAKKSTRLVQFDHGLWNWPLSGGQATQALVTESSGRTYKMPAVIWREQVLAVAGVDYEARVVGLNGAETLVYVMPNDGASLNWPATRMGPLVEEVLAMAASDAGTSGELILPVQTHTFTLDMASVTAGLESAFSPVFADLRGLDLQGGTYVWALNGTASMNITIQGLAVKAKTGMAFVYDSRNTFKNTTAYSVSTDFGAVTSMLSYSLIEYGPACGAFPQVKPGYLFLLGPQRQLLAFLAFKPIDSGSPCEKS